MKKILGKYIGLILAILCLILIITLIIIKVSSVNAQSEDKDLKEKVSEELKFLDTNITELMNKLNNIDVIKYKVYTKEINDPSSDESSSNSQESSQGSSQEKSSQGEAQSKEGSKSSEGSSQNQTSESNSSQESGSSEGSKDNTTTISELVPNATMEQNYDQIDWNRISFIAENIYSTWPSMNLDFQKQGISNEYISSLSASMDVLIKSIKDKNKNNALINLFNMYINIPKYSLVIKEDDSKVNTYNAKLNVLNAYTLVSTSDKWDDVKICISNAKANFSKLISSEQNENKKNELQKTYLIIEDLERIIDMNDKNIFFMGYKNLIQEFETI